MPFPKPTKEKNLEIAKRWVYLCARNNFTVSKITRNTFICSKHFPVGELLNIKANPTLEPYNARKPLKKTKERRKIAKVAVSRSEQKDNGVEHAPELGPDMERESYTQAHSEGELQEHMEGTHEGRLEKPLAMSGGVECAPELNQVEAMIVSDEVPAESDTDSAPETESALLQEELRHRIDKVISQNQAIVEGIQVKEVMDYEDSMADTIEEELVLSSESSSMLSSAFLSAPMPPTTMIRLSPNMVKPNALLAWNEP